MKPAQAAKQLVINVRCRKTSAHTDSISPSLAEGEQYMNKTFALICSLASLIVSIVATCFYVHIGHARIENLIQEIIEVTHMHYCDCEAEVRSSSVSVVYVIRLHKVFLKAALQKRGSMEPMESPLDLPLRILTSSHSLEAGPTGIQGRVHFPCTSLIFLAYA